MSRTKTHITAWLAVLLVASLAGSTSWATTYYVNGTCGNDGWTGTSPTCVGPNGPKLTIQAGINAAAAGDTVIVASGTYTGAGNRDLNYNGKAIIVQSETWGTVGWDPYDCVIDCQLGGRGFLFQNNETTSSELHGFTIRNGKGAGGTTYGGGIRCGINFPSTKHGSPYITDCVIENCQATYGGGMSCEYNSHPYLEHCVFQGNRTPSLLGNQGAGLYCRQSAPEVIGCTFIDNRTSNMAGAGGGIYMESGGVNPPPISACIFIDNAALSGGAICLNQSAPDIAYCTFIGNEAGSQGGGLYYTAGGIAYAIDVTNCTFYRNSATLGGSSVAAANSAHPVLGRCILCLGTDGDTAYCVSSGVVTISCCAVWGNVDGDGCIAGQIGSNNNFAAYPGFCDPQDPEGELYIRDASPCAPANSPCQLLIGAWDVGCTGPLTHYACPSEPNDFWLIQMALDAAQTDDTVVLCDTTWSGDGNRDLDCTKAITVRSEGGNPDNCVIACGGSAGTPHRGFDFHNLAAGTGRLEDIKITGGYSPSWPGGGGVLCRDGAGLTVENCKFDGNHTGDEGGGLCCRSHTSALNVLDCVFENNTSVGIGGGLCVAGSAGATVLGCRFTENVADDDGGGLGTFVAAQIEDGLFERNSALGHGGGAACMSAGSGSVFRRCTFTDNTAVNPTWGAGGAISGGAQFEQCTFDGNLAATEGGGVWSPSAAATFVSCTFHDNGAPAGSAVRILAPYGVTLERSILAFGTGGPAVGGTCSLFCCDVYGNAGGPGDAGPWIGSNANFAADPIFCDAANADFTIRADSPCAATASPCGQLVGAWPVGCYAWCLGDMNCSGGSPTFEDIKYFSAAVGSESSWWAYYRGQHGGADPPCPWLVGDFDYPHNGVEFGDIKPFAASLGQPCSPYVP